MYVLCNIFIKHQNLNGFINVYTNAFDHTNVQPTHNYRKVAVTIDLILCLSSTNNYYKTSIRNNQSDFESLLFDIKLKKQNNTVIYVISHITEANLLELGQGPGRSRKL